MTADVVVQVHFDDLDAFGIVHNSRHLLLFERAVVEYWTERGWTFDPASDRIEELYFVILENSVRYVNPIATTGPVLVRFWIERLGTTSLVYGFELRSVDGSLLHAEGRRVQVKIDRTTRQPAPLSEALRQACEPLLVDSEAA